MEVGLVAVLSADPLVRAKVSIMAEQLLSVEGASYRSFDSRSLAYCARVPSWAQEPTATDNESGTHLLMIGSAWVSGRELAASDVMRDVLCHGAEAFKRFGGSYAAVLWEENRQELLIVSDRLATKKVYHWHSGANFIVATELRALLAHPDVPRAIDETAVGQLLVTSHLLDSRSLVRDISTLEPASITRSGSGGQTSWKYWTPTVGAGSDDGLDRWADRLASSLEPAVRARCGSDAILLPLSGGLDSRAIAAFVPKDTATTARACSFGHRHCYDVRYGRRVAGALGVAFEYLQLPEDFFRRYLEPVSRIADGEVSIESLPMYRLMEFGIPGQQMLMGYIGDILSGGHLIDIDESAPGKVAIGQAWQKKYLGLGFTDELLQRVLLPERYASVRGKAEVLFGNAINAAGAESWTEKDLIVELHFRQSRYISYFGRMLGLRYRVELPFLDLDVMDTFLSMPLRHRQLQRAYRRMLVRHSPKLAAVPEMKTHRPVTFADANGIPLKNATVGKTAGLPEAIQWRLNAIDRALGRVLVAASGGWLGPHNRNQYAHHDESIRRIAPAWFFEKLINDSLVEEWFQRTALRQLFDEHIAGVQNHSIRLNNVVAFLAARRTIGI